MRGVVLAEDKRTVGFFRHLLERLGYDTRKFHFQPAPSGTGAAEAWVRKRYPFEVKLLRSKNYQKSLCTIVVRDGDSSGVEKRKRELDEELKIAGLQRRTPNERIATPVPTWSIETWFLALLGEEAIGEDEPLKETFAHRYPQEKELIKKAAQTWCDDPTSGGLLPSLDDGHAEMARLDTP